MNWSLRSSVCLLASSFCLVPAASAADARPSPEVQALTAAIDQHLAARWAADKVEPSPRADDSEFLRRVYLDLAGRIPPAAEVRAFLADTAADKRQRVVEKLLASPQYVEHFTNIWRGLLVPEAANPDGPSVDPAFEAWMRKQITDNIGYDKMVREILAVPFAANAPPRPAPTPTQDGQQPPAPTPSPAAYYSVKDVKPENLAASTARLFLGVRLECAQCHHHPFAKWKREQFWNYAAFFAGLQRQNQGDGVTPVREVFDRREMKIPGSETVVPALFLDGSEPRWKFKVGARVTLADWITAPDNPYFARAAVNRMWAHFFGTGIVEPVDDLEGQDAPSHPELLEEMARQFVAHGFDWKYLIRGITASRTYQLSSTATHPEQADPRRFARMAVRGLTPEQVFDSLVQATGYRAPAPAKPNAQDDADPPPDRALLMARFAVTSERRTEAQTSILQALTLMNGKFVADVTSLKGNGTLATVVADKNLDTAGKVEALFLAALSRKPTFRESQRLVKYVDAGGPSKDPRLALADIFWALLNSGEFILNH
jgi:hypothetical protein